MTYRYNDYLGKKPKYCWLITISPHQVKTHVQPDTLFDTLNHLASLCEIYPMMESFRMELGSKYKQLHCHFLAFAGSFIQLKDLQTLDGFRIHWKRVRNADDHFSNAWNYCTKLDNIMSQHEVIMQNDIIHIGPKIFNIPYNV